MLKALDRDKPILKPLLKHGYQGNGKWALDDHFDKCLVFQEIVYDYKRCIFEFDD